LHDLDHNTIIPIRAQLSIEIYIYIYIRYNSIYILNSSTCPQDQKFLMSFAATNEKEQEQKALQAKSLILEMP